MDEDFIPPGRIATFVGEGTIIHPTANIGASVLGRHCRIGAHVVIADNVVICDNVIIGNHVSIPEGTILMEDVRIDAGARIEYDPCFSQFPVDMTFIGRNSHLLKSAKVFAGMIIPRYSVVGV